MTVLNKERLLQHLVIFSFIAKGMALSLSTTTSGPPPSSPSTPIAPKATTIRHQCRDRLGIFPEYYFNIHACAMCLYYLLPDGELKFKVNRSRNLAKLQSVDTGRVVRAQPQNQTAMRIVCNALSDQDCHDWTACCQAAEKCCQRQLNRSSATKDDGGGGGGGGGGVDVDAAGRGQCPMTWDGFSCVDSTPAGHTATVQCPAFIKRFSHDLSGSASRKCWPNSSWYINKKGWEWTNYDTCHKTIDHHTILTLKLTFKGLSIALLVPSIVTFLMFRPLRSQLRIKIHINLFLSLALSALFSLLYEAIVNRDLLVKGQSDYFMDTHPVSCKFLNIMSRCMLMTTFSWMFCEGFYLTWLMLQSFRHLSSSLGFCLFGWGIPLLFCVVYSILRVTINDDETCWVTSTGGIEWLINGPTIACIVMNLVFLLAIMRVMVRQLRSHNDNKSVVRRSLRALLILIPLFGLQQFCIMYRPEPSDAGFYAYEIASAVIMSLQGAVVALIFCFFNGEVRGHLKDLYRRLRYKLGGRYRHRSRQSVSMTSSTVQPRTSRPSLASIDTVASVVIPPAYLAGTPTATKKHGDDSGCRREIGGTGGSCVGGEGGSWRVRMVRLQEIIAEDDQESDDRSSARTDSDVSTSKGTNETEEDRETSLSSCSNCDKPHGLVAGQFDSTATFQTQIDPKMRHVNHRERSTLGASETIPSLSTQGPAWSIKTTLMSFFVSKTLRNRRSNKTELGGIDSSDRRQQNDRDEQVNGCVNEPGAFVHDTSNACYPDVVVSRDSGTTTSPPSQSESQADTFSEAHNHFRFSEKTHCSCGAFEVCTETNAASNIIAGRCLVNITADESGQVRKDDLTADESRRCEVKGASQGKDIRDAWKVMPANSSGVSVGEGSQHPGATFVGSHDATPDSNQASHHRTRLSVPSAPRLFHDNRKLVGGHDNRKLGHGRTTTTTSSAIFDDTRPLCDAGFLRGNDSMASFSAKESGESDDAKSATETDDSEITCGPDIIRSRDMTSYEHGDNNDRDSRSPCLKKFYYLNNAFDEDD